MTIPSDTSPLVPDSRVWLASISKPHVIFGLRACQEAILTLSQLTRVTVALTYFVKIGTRNNTATEIMEKFVDQEGTVVDTPNILSCDETRMFWVRWGDGVVSMGAGSVVGKDTVISHTFEDSMAHGVSAVSVNTLNGVNGQWQFKAYEGKLNSNHNSLRHDD